MTPWRNQLYYGDNLAILREHVANESVDLVYLDPPFNSNATYNVLFKAPTGERSQAQFEAFGDTWHWNKSSEIAFDEVMTCGNTDVSEMLRAMRGFLGRNDMMAYLTMMAVRLVELRRILKPNGALYLHCDPTASHYLKVVLDAVFGKTNFKNEIVWRRSHPKGHAFTRFARTHDVIFSYARDAANWRWNPVYAPHDEGRAMSQYALVDEGGRRYQLTSLLNPNPNRPNLTYEFKGVTKVWRWTKERMEQADRQGLIVVPKGGERIPRFKRYLDEQEGVPVGDFWSDIEFVAGEERLGYPTQKPLALLERILAASSNEGDVVLDPFCGCGTTVHAAQKLGRRWIGIDITHLAVGLIRRRLIDAFPHAKFDVLGVPKDLPGARELAKADKHQFELWALAMVAAQPFKGGRKGADGGVDGYLYFKPDGKTVEKAVVSVKGGENVGVAMIRDLIATVDREGAKIGAFLTLEDPTTAMRREASAAGLYKSPLHGAFEKIQIITVEDLFKGAKPHMPWIDPGVFKKARREKTESQADLDL